MGISASWFCILGAPLSISPHSAFAAMQSTVQKASRHSSHLGLTVYSRGDGFAKGQAQPETGIPVVAAARAACPECPLLPICPGVLESARVSGIGILQSV